MWGSRHRPELSNNLVAKVILRAAAILYVDDLLITWNPLYRIEDAKLAFSRKTRKQFFEGLTYGSKEIRLVGDKIKANQNDSIKNTEVRWIPRGTLSREDKMLKPEELIEYFHDTRDEGLNFQLVSPDRLIVEAYSDCSFANAKDMRYQMSAIIAVTTTEALTELLTGKSALDLKDDECIPTPLGTDCKLLFDALQKEIQQVEDKRTLIDFARLDRTVSSENMWADRLTKRDTHLRRRFPDGLRDLKVLLMK